MCTRCLHSFNDQLQILQSNHSPSYPSCICQHTLSFLYLHTHLCVLVRPFPLVNGFLPFIRLIRFPGWSCWVLPSILCWTRLLMSFPKSTMSRRHTLSSKPCTHTLHSLFRFYQITPDSYVRARRRSLTDLPSLIGLRLSQINIEYINEHIWNWSKFKNYVIKDLFLINVWMIL